MAKKLEPEMLVITSLQDAATEDIIKELMNRFNSMLLVYEEDGKVGQTARNCIRFCGLIPTALGLVHYARYRLERWLEQEIDELNGQ